jgi:hypothetical protein
LENLGKGGKNWVKVGNLENFGKILGNSFLNWKNLGKNQF